MLCFQFDENDFEFPFVEVVSDDDLVTVSRQCLLSLGNEECLFRLELGVLNRSARGHENGNGYVGTLNETMYASGIHS